MWLRKNLPPIGWWPSLECISVCANDMTKCVATAVMRNSGSSGRSRDTVWSMTAFSGLRANLSHIVLFGVQLPYDRFQAPDHASSHPRAARADLVGIADKLEPRSGAAAVATVEQFLMRSGHFYASARLHERSCFFAQLSANCFSCSCL